jgi:hypothetical protein
MQAIIFSHILGYRMVAIIANNMISRIFQLEDCGLSRHFLNALGIIIAFWLSVIGISHA